MILLSAETCVQALNAAAINRKTAFRVELAVGLGVFLAHGGASRDARRMLNQAYASAGYECATVMGIDYKTVNRRINATADLFETLPVAKWVGKHSEDALLSALCLGLEPYEFFTVKDVQRYCAPERTLPPVRAVPIVPAYDALDAPVATGQEVISQMFRRAGDQVQDGERRIEAGHLELRIPKDTTLDEIMGLVRQLLDIASESKELLTA